MHVLRELDGPGRGHAKRVDLYLVPFVRQPSHEVDEVTALAPRPGDPEQALRPNHEGLLVRCASELLSCELALAVAVERVRRIVLAVSTDLRAIEDVVGAHGHELRRDLGAVLSKGLDAGGVDRKRQLRVLLASRGIVECRAIHHRVGPLTSQQSLDCSSIRQVCELAGHGQDIVAAPHEHADDIRPELTGRAEDEDSHEPEPASSE